MIDGVGSVKSGLVYAETISVSGYRKYMIQLPTGQKTTIESCLAFETLKEAQAALDKFLPIHIQMKKMDDENTAKLDALRETIIGKPEFKEFANELISKNQK